MNLEAVFFDLDGTLIDSAPDFDVALNKHLALYDMPPIPAEVIRPWVSHGSPALIKLAFGLEKHDAEYAGRRQEFLEIYEASMGEGTVIFDGVKEVLNHIEDCDHNMVWGIVTNKPYYLAKPLIEKIGLADNCVALLGGDSLPERKPHPLPLLHISKQAGVDPARSVYVGDALRDIQSAKGAGMKSVAALYGYYTDDENPDDWQADYQISEPAGLIPIINELK